MIRFMWLRSFAWVAVLLASTLPLLGQSRSEARLLVDSVSVRPGDSFFAAVELTAPPDWHTYWRNSGDSGQRTRIDWKLPDGVTAADILWPTPRRLTEAGLTTYVYDGRVILPVQLTVAPDYPPGPLPLEARVSWLECKTECIPGRATVRASLSVGTDAQPSPSQPAIRAALADLPAEGTSDLSTARWTPGASADTRTLTVTSRAPGFSDFFPFENSDLELVRKTDDSAREVQFTTTLLGSAWPQEIAGLLVFAPGSSPSALSVRLPIVEEGGTVASDTPGSVGSELATPSGESSSLGFMLLLAFLGGMILNIMPCVLPVIALKILGFVKQSGENPGHVRFLGFVYTSGVLTSFALLAGFVLAVQASGKTATWGMQFQNPVFLVAMTTLVTLVALNLFGVFEVTLQGNVMNTASNLASREGPGGAFFNGVFTTVLATPCVAPLLAAALGFAFGQPPLVLLLLFLTAGLGLATPYLLLSLQPRWLKFLPKPGNWMVTFKTLMGFPMLATAIWLLSLAPAHFGEAGVFWLGLFLVCVSIAAWIFGRYVQTGRGRRGWSWGWIGATLVGGYVVILESQLHWRSPPAVAGAADGPVQPGDIAWKPWSPDAVAQARAAGHPVLVDFTATWCVNCQVNKALAIEVSAVKELLAAHQVVTLKADNTREDPAIAAELRRFGRAGVPMVLVYPANPALPPKLLPTLLTEGIVLEALNWAVSGGQSEVAASRGN